MFTGETKTQLAVQKSTFNTLIQLLITLFSPKTSLFTHHQIMFGSQDQKGKEYQIYLSK